MCSVGAVAVSDRLLRFQAEMEKPLFITSRGFLLPLRLYGGAQVATGDSEVPRGQCRSAAGNAEVLRAMPERYR
jgi:hypothetical protein